MNMIIQSTATIRQRGQITIPDEIRKLFSWLSTDSAVTITTTPAQEVLIKPVTRNSSSPDWKKIWEGIELTRSLTKGYGNLSKMVAEDRLSH